jgi:hypothetical protein
MPVKLSAQKVDEPFSACLLGAFLSTEASHITWLFNKPMPGKFPVKDLIFLV